MLDLPARTPNSNSFSHVLNYDVIRGQNIRPDDLGHTYRSLRNSPCVTCDFTCFLPISNSDDCRGCEKIDFDQISSLIQVLALVSWSSQAEAQMQVR